MKTLDEVIGFMEERQKTEDWDVRRDALQYLKWYKELADDSEAYVKWRENPPLTWYELRRMEGKPVWVVVDGKERWRIIREVTNEHLILESGLPLHKCWMNHPDGWQAYRKERS